ncbi:MAG TPA: filamentous hemagglutinin family protein, partial [Burkholderiaceae bacterium]|nr:filamentous hemagglutinin family protein [Burkholderiaceae bacterium]
MNAGGSVILDNATGQQANVVYTAGVANVTTAPAFSPLQTVVLANGRYQRLTINPELTQGGGDLTIDAGANVVGTDAPLGVYTTGSNQDGSSQTVNQWLLRGGQGSASVPTVWWPYFTEFQQGFGALGGGNLSIHAGGDIVRVDAVVAGQGYDTGNGAVQLNAGALTLIAAGKVEQGLFYDQNGAFQVRANAIVANSAAINPANAQTIFAMGENDLIVQTREASTFYTPFNPTASAPWAYLINSKTSIAYQDQFFTYGNTGGLDARVAGGALSLGVSSQSSILPPNVQLEAFGGPIAGPGNATELSMFPSGQGQLRVLANGDVTGLNLFMSQADASLLGQSSAPAPDTTNELINLQVPGVFATPLHASDGGIAAIVAQGGSISYDSFSLPKTTLIMATGSIGPQVSIDIQNSNANSLSIISAGQQINFANPTFTTDHIFVGGPGAAQIVAGGAINLGTDGNGIDSRGNLDNASLPAVGASLIVAAGAGQSPSGFANDPAYQGVIDNFVQFDAFASTGSASAPLNAKVIASLSNDPLLAQFVGALQAGLGARSATYNPVADPNSAFSKALANLTPAQLAVGAVRLAAAIQVVNNAVFVQSQNSDTFAPAYAAFADLFPSVAINANGLRQFTLANLFYTQNSSASQVQSLQSQALVGVPAALVTVITQAHSQFLSLETSLANQGPALGQLMQSNNFGSLLIGLAQNPSTAGILSKVFQDSGISSTQAGNYINALVAVGAASGGSSSTAQSSIGASSSPGTLGSGPIVATESPQQALAQSAYSLFLNILSSSPAHSPAMDLLANSILQNPTSALAQALGRADSSIASAINELSAASSSSLSVAIATLDPSVLAAGMREIFANSLSVAGASLDALKASGQLLGSGSPYARELTALAQSSAPTAVAGLNDLSMDYNEIKTEETGMVSVFAPQGSVIVGSSNPPVLDPQAASKTADQLGIFSIGGGDIIGMVRDNFNVFQSRVFTVAGGDIDLWSSLSDIDAGRGPRDVAVAAPPRLVTDPATGLQYLDVGASVSGSGIG